jgi:cysteine synthase A
VDREWVNRAVAAINADFQRSADTHMIRLEVPGSPDTPFYLKDESTHPSGSLKHRLARSLFLYGLCNGWIRAGTTIVEASSGSTAVSEAYFAQLLKLPFVAVMPRCTSKQKIEQIEFQGGRCHFVDHPAEIMEASRRLAEQCDGHFMDQFTYAERATDWRGNNNIAESLFEQLILEPCGDPAWVVVGAGTGGTSATIGRYIRYFQRETQLCVVDPEQSVFFDYFQSRDTDVTACGSRIEGIGQPCVPTSFLPDVVDRMIQVPDCFSIAAVLYLERLIGRRCGASTGTNLIGAIELASEMRRRGRCGAIVTLICDSGHRYRDTYYNPAWRQSQQLEPCDELQRVESFFQTGEWDSICSTALADARP